VSILSCVLHVFHVVSLRVHQEAREQLSPLAAALEKLQQEKQELGERRRQRQEEGQEKVSLMTCHILISL